MHSSKRVDIIQALRALAAIVIILGHGQVSASLNQEDFANVIWFHTGWGVDLFFLISGFIIVHASKALEVSNRPGFQFFSRRIARVVPLYWATTFVYIIITTVKGNLTYSPWYVMKSLFFIPYSQNETPSDLAFPIYNLGWTLNYEMFFYLIFGLCLSLAQKRAAPLSMAILSALVLIGWTFDLKQTALRFWTQPILLEFCLGMGIALCYEKGVRLPGFLRLFLLLIAVLAVVFQPLAALMTPIEGTTPNNLARVIAFGVPMAGLLAAAVLASPSKTPKGTRVMRLLGDASYSLYLLHPLVIILLWKTPMLKTWLATVHTSLFLAMLLSISALISILSFKFFEKPSARGVASSFDKLFPPLQA